VNRRPGSVQARVVPGNLMLRRWRCLRRGGEEGGLAMWRPRRCLRPERMGGGG